MFVVRDLVFADVGFFQATLLPSFRSKAFLSVQSANDGLGKKTERNTDEQEELDWMKIEVAKVILRPF